MNEFDRFFGGGLELETPRVLLRKMKAEDLEHFKALSTDENTWKYFSKDLSQPAEMEAWINEALEGYNKKQGFLLRSLKLIQAVSAVPPVMEIFPSTTKE